MPDQKTHAHGGEPDERGIPTAPDAPTSSQPNALLPERLRPQWPREYRDALLALVVAAAGWHEWGHGSDCPSQGCASYGLNSAKRWIVSPPPAPVRLSDEHR